MPHYHHARGHHPSITPTPRRMNTDRPPSQTRNRTPSPLLPLRLKRHGIHRNETSAPRSEDRITKQETPPAATRNAPPYETSVSIRQHTKHAPPCPMTMRRLMRQMTMRTTLRQDGMTSKQRLAAANRTATEKNSTRRHGRDDRTIREDETQMPNAQERDDTQDAQARRTTRRSHRHG